MKPADDNVPPDPVSADVARAGRVSVTLPGRCRIVLAPMQGVVDAPMRARLTGIGGYDRCVTEFVRVSERRLPERVFFRLCPELASGGHTVAGTPVYVQLLGSHPEALAANARRAAALGAPGIDLNFGCPAKIVNRSEGGSILLREPERVAHIVRTVRDSIPADVPLSVKIRLGYADANRLAEIVAGIRTAGATELAIHARTKFDGYRPPAKWCSVRSVMLDEDDATMINGEVWTVSDSLSARSASGCRHVMLGRGALAAPDLALRIRNGDVDAAPMSWSTLLDHVQDQFHGSDAGSPRHIGNRTKQWLAYLKRGYPEAAQLFDRIRRAHDRPSIDAEFDRHRRDDLTLQTETATWRAEPLVAAGEPVAGLATSLLHDWLKESADDESRANDIDTVG